MTIRMAAFAAAAAILGLSPFALAQAPAAPSGVWAGEYGYDGAGNMVPFQASFTAKGAGFTGGTIEPNTFGDPGVLFLTANVSGAAAAGGEVNFVKTYDGTGGQSHSVEYAGEYDSSGCIEGIWRIGAAAGPFKMCSARRPNS